MSDIVVIGAGLGGLLCGSILARSGRKVIVLEQGIQSGGALQCFVREGIRFDTGFHSVGGLERGGPLEKIFRPLGLMELPWERAEADEGFPFLRLSSFSSEATPEEREHVLAPYLKGIWRLRGGGQMLVDALVSDIRARGGEVLLRKKVTSIERGVVSCQDGSSFSGTIVSDIHPLTTFGLCRDHVRPSYLRMLRSRADSPGIFSVYIKLKPGAVEWHSGSIFIDGKLMIHFGDPDSEGRAISMSLLSSEIRDSEECIRLAYKRFPSIEGAIEKYWTSSPSTWERYTGTPCGSAYGAAGFISPRTPVAGLYLSGQNIGLHGVLGVSMSAVATCREILGAEAIEKMFGL